ncbi:type II toxin-antitoxin system PemK/MazF family toxin [Mariniflexile sp.]|uniref:type II toxin-antitoxin system PemK/MazF family toxin n=1 Tax=Mariniflexile sp. TaxID=1979402 RepID=UPI004047C4EE
MKQGEIWSVYFDPIIGSEHGGNRPAVIMSGNAMNQHLRVIIVCPITSSIRNYQGNPIIEADENNGLSSPSEIMVFHIRSISKERFKKKIGFISNDNVIKIKETLDDLLRF